MFCVVSLIIIKRKEYVSMADIKAFQALRYCGKKFPKPPVAPPYDILSENMRATLAAKDHNIINIDKPGRADDPDKYDRAKVLLKQWKEEGALITEDKESLYVYQEEYTIPESGSDTRYVRTGFFATLKLESFDAGIVLPHEKTLSAPKADRLQLMKATKGNISPIFGLYHDRSNAIKAILTDTAKQEPVYAVYTDDDGTKHTLWQVTDVVVIKHMISALKDERIIIADGHHRYETALTYRDYLKQELGETNPKAEYIMLCLVDFSDDGLVVLPTHRQVTYDIATNDLVEKLRAYFDVSVVTKVELIDLTRRIDTDTVVIGLYAQDEDRCYVLRLKQDCDFQSLMPAEASAAWKKLNVSVLSYVVFQKVLGLSEEKFQQVVTYTHSVFEALEEVDSGTVNFSFLLQSIDKFAVKEISEKGELMPQKSTYFYPKLFTGFVMYEH